MANALTKWPALAKGLGQIPQRDLLRLKRALEDKTTPLIFDGDVKRIEGFQDKKPGY